MYFSVSAGFVRISYTHVLTTKKNSTRHKNAWNRTIWQRMLAFQVPGTTNVPASIQEVTGCLRSSSIACERARGMRTCVVLDRNGVVASLLCPQSPQTVLFSPSTPFWIALYGLVRLTGRRYCYAGLFETFGKFGLNTILVLWVIIHTFIQEEIGIFFRKLDTLIYKICKMFVIHKLFFYSLNLNSVLIFVWWWYLLMSKQFCGGLFETLVKLF